MERFKKILHKLLFPGIAVVLISVPVAVLLLVYTFLVAGETAPVAYISYVFSAWSLTVVCVNVVPAVQKYRDAVYRNKYIHRYRTDIPFKTLISLYGSLGINMLYAILKFVSGLYYYSVWMITLAVYYICLAVMRFLLLCHVNRNMLGKNLFLEWKKYRLCGILLMLMNIALSGIVVLIIHQNQSFEYAGYLIYVMAIYAFYTVATAAVNMVKYRKLGSPVLSAAKAINLSAAMVSMLALETAMLSQFGSANDPEFYRAMITATGTIICIIIFAMAIIMIAKSTKQLKKYQ